MKFLIVDTYYPAFLHSLYAQHSDLVHCPYAEQWRALMDQCFGTADFYSANLQKLGHDAHEVVANNDALQRQWTRENAPHLWATYPVHRCLRRVKAWQLSVLRAQVEHMRPDVLYVQNLNWTDEVFLRSVRSRVGLIVGQNASSLRPDLDYGAYDLILTSFPHYVEKFRGHGVQSEYLRLAFDPRVLDYLDSVKPRYPVVFVGGYSSSHQSGIEILEHLVRQVPADFWGYGVDTLPHSSPIRWRYHGEAWGLEMYRLLAQSRIALNRHIDVVGSFANNMRLFEATGVGTCLVTDLKDNLHELFSLDTEVVAYICAKDCIEKVRYLLEHEDERAAIAKAGQERTLREHTYYHRMQELVDILERHLSYPERAARVVGVPG